MSADELGREYYANGAAFERKYAGKKVRIKGAAQHILPDYVWLDSLIICSVNGVSDAELAGLRVGGPVDVTGVVSMAKVSQVELTSCVFR